MIQHVSFEKPRKNRKLKIAAGITLPLVVAGLGYALYPKSSDLFNGDVGGWKVSYFEGDRYNTMSASKGQITVRYEDREDVEKVDFGSKNPDALDAKLEGIVYTDSKGTERFSRNELNPSRFDFEVKTQIFDAADRHYNAIRIQIVKDLQEKQLRRLEEIRDSLK